MPLSSDDLTNLWRTTLGDEGAKQGWPTLSGGATYRGAGEGTTPLVQATLSGQQTVGGGTLSGGTTVGGAAGGNTSGVSTSKLGLGGFQLKEEIGRGGMGVVWRARQESLARDIAVKLIRPEAANERTRQGFVAEALVNGVLDHPNIVPVHEMGTAPGGEVFLAMKLVGGTSWDRLLHARDDAERFRAATYDRDKHLGVLDAVANAIAFAHSKGIVHRDLKPENVMVGAYGEVLVMDWGIAVDIRSKPDPTDSRAVHKSAIRSPAGTPNYMAPELAEGRGDDIGPWTDVYLLGGILHEVLTGRPPHRGNSLMALLLAASTSATPAFDAQVPVGLAAICRRALARDHHARYQDVPAFQAALAEYRKHRESENVASAAETALRRTAGREAAKLGGAERSALYGDFAEAVAGYRQALALWDGNESARRGERDARLAYAGAARAAGDLGLAEAQAAALPTGDRDADSLRSAITADRAVADRAARAARRNRGLLMGAAGLIVAGSVAGFLLVEQERARTVEQRDKAVTAEQEAARQRDAALAAEGKAVEQERRARTALASTLIDQGTAQAGQGLNLAALDPLWRAIETAPPDDATSTLRADAWRLWRLIAMGAMGAAGEITLTPPPPINAAQEPSRLIDVAPGPGGRVAALWYVGSRQVVPGRDDQYRNVLVLRIEQAGTKAAPRDHELVDIADSGGLLWLDSALVLSAEWVAGERKPLRDPIIGLDPETFAVRWSVPAGYGRPQAVDADSFMVPFADGWMRCDAVDGRVLSSTLTRQVVGDAHHARPSWWSPAGHWLAVGDVSGEGPDGNVVRALDLHHLGRIDVQQVDAIPRLLDPSADPGQATVRLNLPSPDEAVADVLVSGDGGRLAVIAQGANIRRLLLYSASDGGLVQVLDDLLLPGMRLSAISPTGDAVWLSLPDGRCRLYASGSSTMTVKAHDNTDGWVVTDLNGDGALAVQVKQGKARVHRLADGTLVRDHRAPAGQRYDSVTVDGTALVFISDTAIHLVDAADGSTLGRISPPPLVPGLEYERVNAFADEDRPADAPPIPSAEEPATAAQIAHYLRDTGVTVVLAPDRRSALVYSTGGFPWGRFSLPDGKPLDGGIELPAASDTNQSRGLVNLRPVGTGVVISLEYLTAFDQPGVTRRSVVVTMDAGATAIDLGVGVKNVVGAWRAPIGLVGSERGATLWDLRSGRLLRHLGEGSGDALGIDPDGRLAVTRSDTRLQVWEVATGRRLAIAAMPAHGWVYDWRLSQDGRTLRWIEDGVVRDLVLIDERPVPEQKPAVLPAASVVARGWPRPVPGSPTLLPAAERLAAARGREVPASALRRSAALALAAIPAARRLTVEGRTEFLAALADLPEAPSADTTPPPVPTVLGETPVLMGDTWTITSANDMRWRYVPPGEYRNETVQATVRLSTGFWALSGTVRSTQYEGMPFGVRNVLDGSGVHATGQQREGEMVISATQALSLADPLLSVRLPTVAETIALLHRFGPPPGRVFHWLADRWGVERPYGVQQTGALDPWGAWDRLGLAPTTTGGLPLLDAKPSFGAQPGISAFLSYRRDGKPVVQFDGRVDNTWPVLLVAPAW